MQIDIGLDSVALSYDAEAEVVAEAARLGYGHIWIGSIGDPFQACALRWRETRDVVPGGMGTAIGVVPVGIRSPAGLAQSAAALTKLTAGRFILGIGAGSVSEPEYRRTWGIRDASAQALVRGYLTTMRGFLAGRSVTYDGGGLSYAGARLAGEATPTPLYLGAAGPNMIRLGGELADGIYLSWCTPENVRWTRDQIAAGAARADRDPAGVRLAASVRVCVDDDEDVARSALARALLPYVRGWGSTLPVAFRQHFQRMGFAAEVAEVDRMSEAGAAPGDLVEAFPDRMLRGLGYYGPAAGAAPAIRRFAGEADAAVVRIVPARPGAPAIRAIVAACQRALLP